MAISFLTFSLLQNTQYRLIITEFYTTYSCKPTMTMATNQIPNSQENKFIIWGGHTYTRVYSSTVCGKNLVGKKLADCEPFAKYDGS